MPHCTWVSSRKRKRCSYYWDTMQDVLLRLFSIIHCLPVSVDRIGSYGIVFNATKKRKKQEYLEMTWNGSVFSLPLLFIWRHIYTNSKIAKPLATHHCWDRCHPCICQPKSQIDHSINLETQTGVKILSNWSKFINKGNFIGACTSMFYWAETLNINKMYWLRNKGPQGQFWKGQKKYRTRQFNINLPVILHWVN